MFNHINHKFFELLARIKKERDIQLTNNKGWTKSQKLTLAQYNLYHIMSHKY